MSISLVYLTVHFCLERKIQDRAIPAAPKGSRSPQAGVGVCAILYRYNEYSVYLKTRGPLADFVLRSVCQPTRFLLIFLVELLINGWSLRMSFVIIL